LIRTGHAIDGREFDGKCLETGALLATQERLLEDRDSSVLVPAVAVAVAVAGARARRCLAVGEAADEDPGVGGDGE
jgi:hypothetical protein